METRRPHDDNVGDPVVQLDQILADAGARFGPRESWPPELEAAVLAVAMNPAPTALWWGATLELLHSGAGADWVREPSLRSAVVQLRTAEVAQLELGCWMVRLRGLWGADGAVAGVLAVAVDLTALRERHDADTARREELIDNLHVALASNRHIGTAVGILMAQRRLTEEAAFDLLRAASQHQHRKLRAVADDVVLTGTLPE